MLAAISDRTAWVFVSHVGFATGEVLPDEALRAIAERAHAHGAHVCIDGYHATASVPIRRRGAGRGRLRRRAAQGGRRLDGQQLPLRPGADLRPRLAGWFADADPFGFRPAPEDNPVPRRRFLAGTTAVASTYHAVEGLRVLLACEDDGRTGVEAVRADTLAKGALAVERAAALGLHLRSPAAAERRGAMLVFAVDHADRLSSWLKTQGVYTDSRRGEVLRMAPFVWNTAGDVERAFDAVAEALRSGAHLAYDPPAEGGPVT